MKIGILTGGGDCPGLNAVIRAAVRKGCFHYDDQFLGFLEGWRGLVEDKSMPLDLQAGRPLTMICRALILLSALIQP